MVPLSPYGSVQFEFVRLKESVEALPLAAPVAAAEPGSPKNQAKFSQESILIRVQKQCRIV